MTDDPNGLFLADTIVKLITAATNRGILPIVVMGTLQAVSLNYALEVYKQGNLQDAS